MNTALLDALDARATQGQPVRLWWRDDDAVVPTGPLDRLLDLSRDHAIPLALAVIPEPTGAPLADRLGGMKDIRVAVHGWSHRNHAPPGEKKQELGAHRPAQVVLDELAMGLARLRDLHRERFVPVLVPPWNRIDAGIVAALPALGFRALSTFGPAAPSPLQRINTHVDLMDWHGTRGGRPTEALFSELASIIARPDSGAVGILSHHLVHDAQAWAFLATLFDLTRGHPGCVWIGLDSLLMTGS